MPKSKTNKSKSATKPASKKAGDAKKHTETVVPAQVQTTPTENAGASGAAAKASPAKSYRSAKPAGLSHKQKSALAHHVMVRVGDLMEMEDAKLANEDLTGVDRKLMGAQLAAWVSYLPGSYWDSRLPQPSRARGRRKL